MIPSPSLARGRAAGPDAPRDDARAASRKDPSEGGGAVLACAACGEPVTTGAARVDRSGAHAHTFTNPHGLVFRIGCFEQAPGCVTASEPSTLFTWFPGHAWQVAACRACAGHLGWLFSGKDRFFGLILDRLVEAAGHFDDGRSQ